MFRYRAHRRLSFGIAALVILLASLLPALSQAWVRLADPAGPAVWAEVCSVQGSRPAGGAPDAAPGAALGVDAAAGHGHGAPATGLEHCPCCGLHLQALGVPPSAPSLQLPPRLAEAVPRAFLAAPRTLPAWVSAQPRAPPQA